VLPVDWDRGVIVLRRGLLLLLDVVDLALELAMHVSVGFGFLLLSFVLGKEVFDLFVLGYQLPVGRFQQFLELFYLVFRPFYLVISVLQLASMEVLDFNFEVFNLRLELITRYLAPSIEPLLLLRLPFPKVQFLLHLLLSQRRLLHLSHETIHLLI
jgi:hypothetical protein